MRQQNIQIVNHHVIYHINIEAARREYAEAMNFKVQRTVQHGHHRDDAGIESLQVPDLQDAPALRRRRKSESSASATEAAIGFSTSTSMPSSSRRQPTRACSTVGTATLAASTRPASDSMSGMTSVENSCGDLRGALGVRVHDADQFGVGELAIHARMVPPEIPRADDRYADFLVWLNFQDSRLPLCRRSFRHPDGVQRKCFDGDACGVRGFDDARAVK